MLEPIFEMNLCISEKLCSSLAVSVLEVAFP